MRILIAGNLSSTYLYHFVKDTVLEMDGCEITLVNTGRKVTSYAKEYLEFFKRANIQVIGAEGEFAQNLASGYRAIKKAGHFDVCHLHYLDDYNILFGTLAGKFCATVIAHYWGSDWLRAGGAMRRRQEELLQISDYVVTDSREIYHQIEAYYGGQFDSCLRLIRFKVPVIEEIRQGNVTEDVKKAFMEKYEIPADKVVIACGYSGSPAHQHLEILNAAARIPDSIKRAAFLVIPVTYGTIPQYVNELEARLRRSGFQSLVIREYLSDLDVACLRSAVDVFVNMQQTDAYSSTLLEYTYLNKIIINGSWLDYSDLEKAGAFYEKAGGFDDLTAILEYSIACFREEEAKFSSNRQAVHKYQDPLEKNELWRELYCNKAGVSTEKRRLRELVSERNLPYLNEMIKTHYMRRMLCIRDIREKAEIWAKRNRVLTAVIYGAGHLGEVVYETLKGSSLQSLFIADKYIRHVEWYAKNLIPPEEIEAVRPDIVIITPTLSFDEIKYELAARFDCKFVTLDEWISEVEL